MALERVIHRRTDLGILRSQRGTTNEVARVVRLSISGNPSPQKRKHLKRSMLAMYGRATEFDDGIAQELIRREIEFARPVVTHVSPGGSSGLQPIRSHDLLGRAMLDDEMVANGIEFIRI